MPFFFYDPTMILLIPAILLALWAQHKVKSTFDKYSKVPSSSGTTGGETARMLLQDSGLGNVQIEEVKGKLTDHYDPRTRVLRLSSAVSRGRSVADIGIAAHEVGHAIQHHQAYAAFQVRQLIFPVANLGSTLAFPLIIAGLFFAVPSLMDIGIILFSGAVLFQVVTLPVEFNASSRALGMLRSSMAGEEVNLAGKVLNAAAMTYVAATAVAVLNLLRLLVLRGGRD